METQNWCFLGQKKWKITINKRENSKIENKIGEERIIKSKHNKKRVN
jgi:hypothetical protein